MRTGSPGHPPCRSKVPHLEEGEGEASAFAVRALRLDAARTTPAGKGDARMPAWIFEPGHTAAEFCVRHMMVTWVRGHLKNIHGNLEFDPDNPARLSLEA